MAVAVTAALAAVVAVSGSDDSSPDRLAGPPDAGPVSVSGSYVELYSLETLARRQVAFDGTVEAVDGDRIAFRVGGPRRCR